MTGMLERDEVVFKIVDYGSQEYVKSVRLREEILRKPFGLTFLPDELESEKNHIHISGLIHNDVCATAMLVSEGDMFRMQRVAVNETIQSRGIGSALLKYCEEYARKSGVRAIYCHARNTAVSFYLKNGYRSCENMFDENGIPHQKMIKLL